MRHPVFVLNLISSVDSRMHLRNCPGLLWFWRIRVYRSFEGAIGEMMDGIRVYEIGVDPLPSGADDIRGRVQNEPDRLFC
jgi:hypothetical protein